MFLCFTLASSKIKEIEPTGMLDPRFDLPMPCDDEMKVLC